MTSTLLSFGASIACLTQMSGSAKRDCPLRNTELLLFENAGLPEVQSRNSRYRGAVEDVVLGDFDAVESKCAHCLDQNHHSGHDVRRAIGVHSCYPCPFGQRGRGQLREKSLDRAEG